MAISRDEALTALREVEAAEARTRLSRGYRISSSHLILWGVIWVMGYGLSGVLAPDVIGRVWLGLSLLGAVVAVLLQRRVQTPLGGGWRWMAATAAIVCFVVATYAVMHPHSGEQFAIYPVLVLSLAYALAGLWLRADRYVWIGGAIFVLGMAGFAWLQPWLPYWLAVVGGGGLILGGVWLRQA